MELPRLVNPQTKETFVLVRLDEYGRLKVSGEVGLTGPLAALR